MSPPVPCPSLIQRVCVHARGALVTRSLSLPEELPDGPCELEVSGLTAQAEPSSFRVELIGERQVVSLRSDLHLKPRPAASASSFARLEEARRELAELEARALHVQQERGALQSVDPRLRLRRLEGAPGEGVRDALAASALLHELLAAADARVLELTRARRALEREVQDIEAALAGQSSDRHQETRRVVLGLRGAGALRALRLTYVVDAARWWPAYCARLQAGGRAGTWAFDALVTQATGEDWSGVELSLSTADLVADARLPELPALRLGKAQPPRPKGYRSPPEGLEALFAGYDAALAEARRGGVPASPYQARAQEVYGDPFGDPFGAGGALADDEEADDAGACAKSYPDAADEPDGDYFDSEDELEIEECGAPPPPPPGAMPMGGASFSMPSRAPAPKAELSNRSVDKAKKRSAAVGGRGGKGGGGGLPPEPPAEEVTEAREDWLDFDGLTLVAREGGAQRGKLRKGSSRPVSPAGQALLAQTGTPPRTRDPREERGSFDYRFEAQGTGDVPSALGTTRVRVQEQEVEVRQVLSVAPGIDDAVYREAELRNPLETPLLGGPLDVYLDGSLLTSNRLEKVGRGGVVRFGLGVEERVRVARNARIREETSGLIGKTTSVHHEVRIELRSSLGVAVPIEVRDRVPVVEQGVDDLQVVLVGTQPQAKPYDQLERGARVEGGLLWELELQPGEARELSLDYRLELPAKREVQGGNRRD